MIKKLIGTTMVGILGAKIIPAAFTGVMYSAAAVLSAHILFIAFVGMSPLLMIGSVAAKEEKPDALSVRPRLVRAIPPRGANSRAEGFEPSPDLRFVHFDFDRAGTRPSEQKRLEVHVEWLKANPGYAVLVEGGADQRDYLVARGVSPERITIVSAGDVKPACRATNKECRSLDRRADFLGKGSEKQAP